VRDDDLHKALNARSSNYWDVYIAEILGMLGAKGTACSLDRLADGTGLADICILIIGQQSGNRLTETMITNIRTWVEAGGILIGFGLIGLDDVFGIEGGLTLDQEPDDYTISAYFDCRPHPLTHEIHPLIFKEQRLPIVSDVRCCTCSNAKELARIYGVNGQTTDYSAISWSRYGKGYAGYFAFDVAKTIWLLHQGRPIPESAGNHRQGPRTFDLSIIGQNSRKIPYADEMCTVVQNMIAQSGLPFVFQVPPKEGRVCDALLYWGGDEYYGPTELSLNASDWMREKGLPYHINIEAENHPMSKEQARHILDNGHEISAYYHKLQALGWEAGEELYVRQSDEFFQRFGRRPVTTVNGVLLWNGWVDSARWMEKAGSKADNSFAGHPVSLDHPEGNMPYFGFGFGTTYPFTFYDNHTHGNRRIDILEQPIVCYEIGHRGSLLDSETKATDDVHLPVEMALQYHWVMNMFYHPHYIADFPRCREAIEEILDTIDRAGATVVHMGNDELYRWWRARENVTMTNLLVQDSSTSLALTCDWPDGVIVKLLVDKAVHKVLIDDLACDSYEVREEFAGKWLYVVVPQGRHQINVMFK